VDTLPIDHDECYSHRVSFKVVRPPPEVIGGADAVESLWKRLDLGEIGPLVGRPVIVVALEDMGPASLPPISRLIPCVVVGVHREGPLPSVSPLDVMLTTTTAPPAPWVACPGGVDGVLEALVASITQAPLAAVTLVQVLRMSSELSVVDGLVVESLAYGVLQAGPEHQAWRAGQSRWERPKSSEPSVLLDRMGPMLTITLNRPRLQNAFDVTMRDALVEALELAAADSSVKHVEVNGNGPSFSIGGDLREFGTAPDPANAHAVRMARSAAAGMAACADRTTVHLHGYSIGAGIELPAFARRIVAAPDTAIRLPELSMGLIPGAGGTVSIPGRIGRTRTGYLALSGTTLDAETALAWGLVDELEAA
jgi:hypothetical protein